MADYSLPRIPQPKKAKDNEVLLIANGDLRLSANQNCWEAQKEMEAALTKAIADCGRKLVRAHKFKEHEGHGFIGSQQEGMAVFKDVDPDAPLIVAESVWQYSHHILHGLLNHRGPILTVANWSGTWPGLVGMLNLNGSLTKAGVKYSTLWSEDFTDAAFRKKLANWLDKGKATHITNHVTPLAKASVPAAEKKLGQKLAEQLKTEKAIMGVFDEGCMGMFNAIIPDHLLNPTGIFKERLSQSALYYETTQAHDDDARRIFQWYLDKGMTFHFGPNPETDLTEQQVLQQCKMYAATLRIADTFGCDLVGIQYQQGLKDLLPASDLVEGTLNNSDRPDVWDHDGSKVLYEGEALPHFNEVDECAGVDALMTNRVHKAMGQPVETTLHDLRWGDWDQSGTTDEYVWVFLISGSAPPAHFINGWAGADGHRQPPMYFRLGGSTLRGVSKPGEIVWSRIYIANNRLNMDLGRAKVIELPGQETERRWQATTYQWPIMHAVTYGVTRDQMMAQHQANHLNVAYATDADAADKAMLAKAAMAEAMGMKVNLCGTDAAGKPWANGSTTTKKKTARKTKAAKAK